MPEPLAADQPLLGDGVEDEGVFERGRTAPAAGQVLAKSGGLGFIELAVDEEVEIPALGPHA